MGSLPPVNARRSGSAQPVIGVILVHGLNGNQGDMEELAEGLAAQGLITENILLPGHGSDVRDMLPIGWQEWSLAVRHELHTLKQRCDRVFLVGHSLGGALCLHTAAHEEVAGVVSMCAPLHLFSWTLPAVRFARRFTPLVPTVRKDVRDPQARRRYKQEVYRWTPMAPVESMLLNLPQLRAELPLVKVPALVMSARHDHVVPISDGYKLYHLLGSTDKQHIILHRSYHVIMKDYDREEVFSRTLAFIRYHGYKDQQKGGEVRDVSDAWSTDNTA